MITLSAILDNIRLRKDKTVSIVFASQELTDKDILRLLQYRDQFGWLVFKPDEQVKEDEIPQEDSGYEKGVKSTAQRLRSTAFVYFIESGGDKSDFSRWYEKYREGEIEKFKQKIDEL